jgi:hypothetical protein
VGEILRPFRRRVVFNPRPVTDVLEDGDQPLAMGLEFGDRPPPDLVGSQGAGLHGLDPLAHGFRIVVGNVGIGRLEKGIAPAQVARRDQGATGQEILGANEHGPLFR